MSEETVRHYSWKVFTAASQKSLLGPFSTDEESHTIGPNLFISAWALSFPAMRQQFQVQVPINSHRVGQEEFVSPQMEIALTFTAPSSAMQNIKTTDPVDRTKCSSARHLKFTDDKARMFALC